MLAAFVNKALLVCGRMTNIRGSYSDCKRVCVAELDLTIQHGGGWNTCCSTRTTKRQEKLGSASCCVLRKELVMLTVHKHHALFGEKRS